MKFLTTLLCVVCCAVAMAQDGVVPLGKCEVVCDVDDLLSETIEVVGSTQGLAISGDYAFSMHDKGQCVIIDLKRMRYVNSFVLEGNTGHCNNASFGVERYSRDSQFPLFYVTECRGERACYVNDITLEGSRLVQKIFYSGDEIVGPCDWAVDASRKLLYLYCTIGEIRMLMWFELPRLSDSDERGEVHLKLEDSLGSIPAGDIKIPQGSLVTDDYIFLPEGVPARGTALNVIHRNSARLLQRIDLTATGIEPEGVACYKGWLYMSLHTPREPRHSIIYRYRINR